MATPLFTAINSTLDEHNHIIIKRSVKNVEKKLTCVKKINTQVVKNSAETMHGISGLIKSTIPNYLSNLPIPDSFTGWFKLSIKDWFALIPPTALLAGIGYTAYLAYCPVARCASGAGKCNQSVRKHEAKVVDMIDVEDIAEKAAFCRCWKTKNWPYCDGSHGEHNKLTGDNVGPVVIKKNK